MAKRRALHVKQHRLRKKQPSPETVRADGTAKNKSIFDDLLRQYYWLIGTALIIFTVAIMMVEPRPLSFRPFNGPFYGLHSWAKATGSWSARSHAHYGLGYTKGFTTWAVGDPPTENPKRYVDHPQLPTLLMGGVMAIFGANDWTPQLVRIITTVMGILILLRVLRGLLKEKTALLAMLFLGLLPLMGYFGAGGWLFVITSWALWRYLVLIGSLSDGPSPKTRHLVEFAIALFLMVQLSWSGLFYAFTFGLHYVLRSMFRRGKLRPAVLMILIVMPLTSLAMNFAVMRAGYEGETQKIFDLYKWRATKDEGGNIQASQWFSTLLKHSVSNFTWPVLILITGHCGYLLAGRAVLFYRGSSPGGKKSRRGGPRGETNGTSSIVSDKSRLPRDFPQIWLFLLPGVILLIVFRGLLREHQYWLRPFAPFVAISASLGLMMIADILRKIHRRAAAAGIIAGVIIIAVFCTRGLAAYRQIRWQSPRTIELFRELNRQIPPEKALLTFKDFVIKQHPAKGSFYRPEYAWYLDRDMIVAQTIPEIEQKAQTGRFTRYFIPDADQPIGGAKVPPSYQKQLKKLSQKQLVKLLQDPKNKMLAGWELRGRHRREIIKLMKQKYHYEYFDNKARPGEENYCNRRNTPCYIFDLMNKL
ncbi:MAG: hypothetical protein KAJ52_00835 [Sedimentisphaerales bacterium]|nr:hypothetical protein [Sedimentisphaerales bacterium]